MPGYHIRKARVHDVKAIHGLIYKCAQKELLLARSFHQLYNFLRDFVVLTDGEDTVLGCCALSICWEGLGEIRSLVVDPGHERQGLGRRLVTACLDEARELGLARVFTLTYVPGFFSRLGFAEVGKDVLPHKIWADCINCPKFPECDETAMLIELIAPANLETTASDA